jgi:Domain of unknown function (DUF1835)
MGLYHIFNGDCLAEQLRQIKIDQKTIICRECLVDGDVNADTIGDFWTTRTKYFADAYQVTPEMFFDKTISEFEKLNGLPNDSEVCLWFEDDLFCQVNMWFVISQLSKHSNIKIYRVFPVTDNSEDIWKGFSISDAGKLQQALSEKVEFSAQEIELTNNLWNAYRENNFDRLRLLSKTTSYCFRFLEEVCRAHIDRYPSNNELSRPDNIIREIIQTKSKNFKTVFLEFSKRAGIYGFTDLQVKRIYDRYINK